MTPRANLGRLQVLAVLTNVEPLRVETAQRCVPTLDAQSPRDMTAVCSRCGRRLTMDDMGGGEPGPGPMKPLPACKQEPTP